MQRLANLNGKEFMGFYRIRKLRFKNIVKDLGWTQRVDAANALGHFPEVQVACAIRQLALGEAPKNLVDVYGMGATTIRKCLEKFCTEFVDLYEDKYLNFNLEEVVRLNETVHGIPGLMGSLDCTHVQWDQCPKGFAASFRGRSGHPSLILEAVADAERRFVHFYWGTPGAQNDINVLRASTLLDKLCDGSYPSTHFCLGEESFELPYLFVDGIYPSWSCFAGTQTVANDPAWEKFKTIQESVRKDVECAFGLLKKMWKIVQRPLLKRRTLFMEKIVKTVLILHNMNIDDRIYEGRRDLSDEALLGGGPVLPPDLFRPPEGEREEGDPEYLEMNEDFFAGFTLRDQRRRIEQIEDKNENKRLLLAIY